MKIDYSHWPKEVKEEFKNYAKRTVGSTIHTLHTIYEEEKKKKLNEENSLFNKAVKSITELKDYIVNFFDYSGSKAEKVKKNNENKLDELILKIKQKELCFPTYIKQFEGKQNEEQKQISTEYYF